MDAPRPIKKPKTLAVPIASLGGIFFLMRKGTNSVAPPIPTTPEIIEKRKAIIFDCHRLGRVLFFQIT